MSKGSGVKVKAVGDKLSPWGGADVPTMRRVDTGGKSSGDKKSK